MRPNKAKQVATVTAASWRHLTNEYDSHTRDRQTDKRLRYVIAHHNSPHLMHLTRPNNKSTENAGREHDGR